MIRYMVVTALLCFTYVNASAQFGYEPYIAENGLKISTKWGKAKDADGERKTALLIGVENTNKYAVDYAYTINLYYEGMLRETGRMEDMCIVGLKSNIGKLNGIYFIPQKFTEQQLKNSDFNFTLEDIEVTETEGCSEDAEEEIMPGQ